jgi:hypothetical protein
VRGEEGEGRRKKGGERREGCSPEPGNSTWKLQFPGYLVHIQETFFGRSTQPSSPNPFSQTWEKGNEKGLKSLFQFPNDGCDSV